MRINEVLNSNNYIVENDDKRGMRDPKIMNDFLQNAAMVGSPGAKDPEVIAKSRAIFVSQPNLSADEAFSIAKGTIDKKNNKSSEKRQWSGKTKKEPVQRDIPQSDKKRGAQLGNQNARKNWSDKGPLKGIKNAINLLRKGTVADVGKAAEVGSDIAVDTFKDLDAISQVRDPKRTGQVFGS